MIQGLWHSVSKTEIIRSKLPKIWASNEDIVHSKYSMISLGTETLVMNKKVPESIQDYMKVPYMKGDFNLPIAYGYALSGILNNGDKVHVMHPHQDKCIVKSEALFKDCIDLSLKKIPLISSMETVLNAIWDSDIDNKKKIVVFGFGNIGALLATTIKYYFNFEVMVFEHNTWKREKAKQMGFSLFEEDNTKGFDIAFNTTTSEDILQFCINNANEEGQIIELSWYGKQNVRLNIGENFHKNRIQIKSSQVSQIPKHKRTAFDFHKRKTLAASILKHNIYDDLITNIIPFKEIPDFFNAIRRKDKLPDGLIYLIKY
ncbi:MAG: hypothetical protein HRT67_05420 [Flavobacteriaceae bacterium]|nr:hypothetical protein [Flavobacteriaceae bacterium]